MKGLQKAGGVGALLQGLLWPMTLLYFFVVLPAYGFTGPDDLNNPAKVLSTVPNSPAAISKIRLQLQRPTWRSTPY